MSYSSRVYRQRNPKAQDESKEKPFFSKKKQDGQGQKKNAFFQAKLAVNEPGDSFEREADSVAHAVVNQGQGSSVQKKRNRGNPTPGHHARGRNRQQQRQTDGKR